MRAEYFPRMFMFSSSLRTYLNSTAVGYRLLHVMATKDQRINMLKLLFQGAVDSVKPKALFESFLQESTIKSQLCIPNKRYHVVGFGKAVLGMAVQIERILGKRLGGCISIPIGTLDRFKNDTNFQLSEGTRIDIIECARNNLPDEKAVEAARKIKSLAESLKNDDVLCVLVSGGGSALLPLPKPPLTLEEKLSVIKLLASAGASIEELNVVRIHLSDVKGGKLAHAAKNSHKILSFILSDIVGDPVPLIASGPTVQTNLSPKDAMGVLEKYQLNDKIPQTVLDVLNRPCNPNSAIPGDIHLIGSNKIAIEYIVEKSSQTGILALPLTACIQGNVSTISIAYVELVTVIRRLQSNIIDKSNFIEAVSKLANPLCFDASKANELAESILLNPEKDLLLIVGGETTVVVQGHGLGGRNQELALRFSLQCYQKEDRSLKDVVLLSAGTDGIDGPTDAAGAIGASDIIERYNMMTDRKNVTDFIKDNDSNTFYKLVENGKYHIVTGHTGTNVMDIHMLYVPWKS